MSVLDLIAEISGLFCCLLTNNVKQIKVYIEDQEKIYRTKIK